jgi:release factor glutamine methyltransferase
MSSLSTWRTLWAETAANIGDRASARWLCEVAAGAIDGDDFTRMLETSPTARMVAHLDAMLARLAVGEPLQYVLGQWSFRHIDLAIDARVLIPRPETELVAEAAIERALMFGPTRLVADLGTGSGAIGLSLAHELPLDGTTVWITDSSAPALDVARANTAGLGCAGRNVRIGIGSWFDALPVGERFDVIVSNPPYIEVGSAAVAADVTEWEPASALFAGADGLDDIRSLVAGAPHRLASGGWLVLEIGSDQGDRVADLLGAGGYADIEILPDLSGRDRIAVGRPTSRPSSQPKRTATSARMEFSPNDI